MRVRQLYSSQMLGLASNIQSVDVDKWHFKGQILSQAEKFSHCLNFGVNRFKITESIHIWHNNIAYGM